MGSTPAQSTLKVWDLPVRLGHWLLTILLFGAWWTADSGAMLWHRYIGYTLAGLLTFRVYWGFFGSDTARFRHFVRGPDAILAHLRSLLKGQKKPIEAGHNPLGALSTLMLLSLLLTQVGLGLFAVDVDGMEAGPLSFYVSFEAGRDAARWHERVFDGLLIMVALHITTVLYYWLAHRQGLIGRMIHGRDGRLGNTAQPLIASLWRTVPGLAVAGLVVWYLKSLDVPL